MAQQSSPETKHFDNGWLIVQQLQAHVHGALAANQRAVHGGNLGSDALLHCAPSVDQLGENEVSTREKQKGFRV